MGDLDLVSIFSGAGGLDLGLEAAGFVSRVVTDIDPYGCSTVRASRESAEARSRRLLAKAEIIEGDITTLDMAALLKRAGIRRGSISLLAGGPPCQAFSVFGQRRGRADPRGRLVYEYLKVLEITRPEAFVFENVYGILSSEDGRVFSELCKALERPGGRLKYSLSVHRLNAVDYGVPQFRDRVFVIGHRHGNRVVDIPATVSAPDSLFGQQLVHRTVRDALRGLPAMGAGHPANHVGRNHSQRIVDRYASLRPGERDHHTRINKLDLNRPSFTIIVGSDKGGGKGHVHPTEPREVTPRESARIQTFPDWWSFSGTSRHPIRQVGNAVPPLLAASVGNALRKSIFGLPEIPFDRLVRFLGQEHLFPELRIGERAA